MKFYRVQRLIIKMLIGESDVRMVGALESGIIAPFCIIME